MTKMEEKELTLTSSNFVIQNAGADQTAVVANKSLTVKVIGPKSRIDVLTPVSVTALIDMSDKSTISEGYVERPVELVFKDSFSECWLEGSYTVNVRITPKKTTPQTSQVSKAS